MKSLILLTLSALALTAGAQVSLVGTHAVNPKAPESIHMSDDGEWCLFAGDATTMPGASSTCGTQVFLRRRSTGKLEVITRDARGAFSNHTLCAALGISGDGRYVLFGTNATNVPGVTLALPEARMPCLYRYDRVTGDFAPVMLDVNGRIVPLEIYAASISSNGRFVTFVSGASNLVPNDVGGPANIFVRDMATTAIERVSMRTAGRPDVGDATRTETMTHDGRFAVLTNNHAENDATFAGFGPTSFNVVVALLGVLAMFATAFWDRRG